MESHSPEATPERSKNRVSAENAALRWIVLALLSLGMVIAYTDRINFSVALALKEFTSYFRLTDQDRGTLNSAFFWSYAALQIPAGWLVDRYGAKYTFAAGFLLWSGLAASTSLAHSVRQLFLVRLFLGVGESVVTPASMSWIRFHFREKERGLALGIYTAGSKVGSAVGAPLATLLILRFGWRGMFVTLGLGSLLWLVPWLLLARDDGARRQYAPATGQNPPGLTIRALLCSPAILGISLGAFCYSYCFYFYMTWMPAYFLEQRHLPLNSMGIYTMFSFAGMGVAAASGGVLADRIIGRGGNPVKVRKAFTIGGMLIASTEVLGAMSSSAAVAVLFAIVSLTGLGLATANYWALTQALIPGSAIGRTTGIQNCANNLSGIAASIWTGWLKQTTRSYEAPMQAVWLILIIGAAAYLFLARQEYAPRSFVE